MKYIVLVGDGMADEPIARLDNKTPLTVSVKPHMNYISSRGINGTASTVPQGMMPESDTANLSILGYDPRLYSKGRSPLEAASMGIEMKDDETAVRANLVALSDNGEAYEEKIMLDHSSDEIPTEQAKILIEAIESEFGDERKKFYAGISYRHCLIYRDCPNFIDYMRPHDILGSQIKDYLPRRIESADFLAMQIKSFDILNNHPLNIKRQAEGLKKANSLWFWGPGKKPSLPLFAEKYGMTGTVISAVDLIKGIGFCAGMKTPSVDGATGTLHTNYEGKRDAAIRALETDDFVFIHVEAPDECGHRGELENKILSIENIDRLVLGPLMAELDRRGIIYKILLLPDHPTPVEKRTHTLAAVPFVIYEKGNEKKPRDLIYNEQSGVDGELHFSVGHRLLDYFLSGKI